MADSVFLLSVSDGLFAVKTHCNPSKTQLLTNVAQLLRCVGSNFNHSPLR